jgi:hypothetical protein
MTKHLKFVGFTLCVLTLLERAFAHDIVVHEHITLSAVLSAETYSTGFNAFLATIMNDCTLQQATGLMEVGSALEDNNDQDAGGKRSLNHFYDTLDASFGKGLSDTPPDQRIKAGLSSFVWAYTSNCVGYNYTAFGSYGRINVNTTNIWSWQNARGYEWLGVTSASAISRRSNLGFEFRALGQVMHLLEDTTQPQHARNEQHLDYWPGTGFETLWHSHIEDYGDANWYKLNYGSTMLNWASLGFGKMEDFWDRHLYNGSATALDTDANGGTQLGLAEFCNGNFLGERHTYGEFFLPGTLGYYPYPSFGTSINSSQIQAHPSSGIDTFTRADGSIGNAIYYKKVADGVPVIHHSRVTYLGARFASFRDASSVSLNDPNVLRDYHNILIPKAAQYSAGLIDYFFRGLLTTSLPSGTNGIFDLNIENASLQDLAGGGFHLFWDDSTGTRTELTGADFSTNYSGALGPDDSIDAVFASVPSAVDYVLVYQGTIGTSAGVPQDPVDTNIAIAVANFTGVPQILGSTPDGYVGDVYPGGTITSIGVSSPTYAVTSGSLPDGLTMDTDGNIYGGPTSAGTFSFRVTVTDGTTGYSYEQDFTITIFSDGCIDCCPYPCVT